MQSITHNLAIVLKQMRQRALSTWLTIFSVMLGVALAVAILLVRRESEQLFGATDYGYDILIGAKGSPLQLVLNTVYQIDRSPGNIPYQIYRDTQAGGRLFQFSRIAIPLAVGDNYRGQRIVATSPRLFGVDESAEQKTLPADRTMEYRPGRKYKLVEGRAFYANRFEAVIGSEITRRTGLKLGDKFKAAHGSADAKVADEHSEEWTVVGVLEPTRTASDRVVYISLTSFYAINEHGTALLDQAAVRSGANVSDVASGRREAATTQADDHEHDDHDHAAEEKSAPAHAEDDHDHDHEAPAGEEHHDHEHGTYEVDANGDITLNIPPEKLSLSAIMIRARSTKAAFDLRYTFDNSNEASAVVPAQVMRSFFNEFLDPSTKAWAAVAVLVNVVAVVAILVSIYNSVAGRIRDVAILRALGATRARILTLICVEAGLIGLAGAILGIIAGHLLGIGASIYLERALGETLEWWRMAPIEWLYLLAVTLVCAAAGLVPAIKAYRTPVAANLVAG